MQKKENIENQTKSNINWYPGHMVKTKRLISEKFDLIDIVYELIDARIPASSKIADIDSLLKNKPRIIIMTKYDLCDAVVTKKWIKHYEDKGYTVLPIDLKNDNDYKKIIDMTEYLMKDMQNYRISRGLQAKEIRALVIGIPNVGKSTLINKLAGKKVANVGNTPGVTKNITWLKTNSKILLLDTPGILWPKFDSNIVALNLASMTAIKSEVLPLDEVAVHILRTLNMYYPNILSSRYKINELPQDIIDAYNEIGKNMGCVIAGGEIDYERVSSLIVNDIRNEYIKKITFDRL